MASSFRIFEQINISFIELVKEQVLVVLAKIRQPDDNFPYKTWAIDFYY